MTKERAKEFLSAFRAYPAEATDATLREALELASRDSELGDWLSRQQEFDEIFIEKLTSIGPPEGLKENILRSLEAKVHPIQSWRAGWIALAATIVLTAIGVSYQFGFFGGSTQSFGKFRSDALVMVGVRPRPQLDLETASLGTAEAFIDAHEAPRLGRFPQKLGYVPTEGCRVFLWHQQPASLTCFHLPSGNLLHLVVIRKEAVGDLGMPSGPYSENGW
ncbi:MAG TPA: hypothetical protein VHS80_04230, partial [Chthoniobacterales bacterium]|nr:hypothetical protein [Chthoniobacterales bacterium]